MGHDRPVALLLVGNHTCGNRGDCAILRGLVSEIESLHPDAVIEITSRYPVSSSFLLGRPVGPDAFHDWRQLRGNNALLKAWAIARNHLLTMQLLLAVRLRWKWLRGILPKAVRSEIQRIREFDAVIHVGGSFFVDLYGAGQYDHSLATMVAERPLILAGHSMGPFLSWYQRVLARTLLERAALVALREPVSRRLIEKCRFPVSALLDGSDTAWLVRPKVLSAGEDSFVKRYINAGRPTVAVSIRELAPFDKRLGITQLEYEQAFARLSRALINAGYDVIALSTCTGIGGYPRDDRMNALRVAALVDDNIHYRVVMDELSDVELGMIFACCTLVVSTRLHAAIISLSCGIPAFAIRYEHKSEGVMAQLGLPELSISMQDFIDPSFHLRVLDTLGDSGLSTRAATQVAAERLRAAAMIERCLREVPRRPKLASGWPAR